VGPCSRLQLLEREFTTPQAAPRSRSCTSPYISIYLHLIGHGFNFTILPLKMP